MKILKSLLFYPLLWLRGIVLVVGKFVGGFFFLGFIALFLMKINTDGTNLPWLVVIGSAAFSLAIFVLVEFYDQLLLSLNPSNHELTLYK